MYFYCETDANRADETIYKEINKLLTKDSELTFCRFYEEGVGDRNLIDFDHCLASVTSRRVKPGTLEYGIANQYDVAIFDGFNVKGDVVGLAQLLEFFRAVEAFVRSTVMVVIKTTLTDNDINSAIKIAKGDKD